MKATEVIVEYLPAAEALSKSLRSRHVTMISIGGIIGAGLFVGSSAAIASIGPAVLLSYLFAGVIVLVVMRMLSVMASDSPGLGPFTEYVRLAFGDRAGFVTAWLYWYFWVVVVAIEAIAGASLLRHWIDLPVWQLGLLLMSALTIVNLASARSYGEFEFWFSSVKVAAIVAFVIVAGAFVLGIRPNVAGGVQNLYVHGFAPHGVKSIFAGMTTVIFSLCGAEIATVAAAESQEGARALAGLTTTIVVRILLFYVVSIFLILCIVPWVEIRPGESPFSTTLVRLGIPAAANVMNGIVLTAVLSCLNSGVYVTARVMFSLASHRDAPVMMRKVNSRQVPVRAILCGSAFGYIAVMISILSPERLFTFLVNASGALMLIIYFAICLAYWKLSDQSGQAPVRARKAVSRSRYLAIGTALAIAVVMISMAFIVGLQSQFYASVGCLAVALIAQSIVYKGRVNETE